MHTKLPTVGKVAVIFIVFEIFTCLDYFDLRVLEKGILVL